MFDTSNKCGDDIFKSLLLLTSGSVAGDAF